MNGIYDFKVSTKLWVAFCIDERMALPFGSRQAVIIPH
jgi:hypothetical protein